MTLSKFIFHERQRGDGYKFLAACFYAPQKDLFLREKLSESLSHALGRTCPAARVFAGQMEDAIGRYTSEELSIEYARLFLGPYELLAPPYGSIYLEKKRMVMGDSTVEVAGLYQKAGLSLADDFKDLPDHIAVELEFMYYLVYTEVTALEQQDGEKAKTALKFQETFWNKFPARWIPLFCSRIKEGTRNDFYTALAGCLLALLEVPHPPEPPPGIMERILTSKEPPGSQKGA